MDIEASLTKLQEKLDRGYLSTSATNLYAKQVEAKFKSVCFSLDKLKELERPAITSSGTGSSVTQDDVEKVNFYVNFYCDCFWDFLRSSIDILAQLINELERTSPTLNEKSVDIKKVAQNLDPSLYPKLKTSVDYLLRTRVFKTLEDYRHCSMHRRQVYIKTEAQPMIIGDTSGYDASTGQQQPTTYRSYLCCNPWDLSPVIDYSRTVTEFCVDLLKKTEKLMVTIINRLA